MSVARHTLYNLAGSVAPMVVSIVTVPIYLHLVGPTRYGVLSIVWLFLGYFGLFDPGLSRAATYHIARLHDAPAKERGDVFWTALVVNAGFGIVGGLVLYAVARPLFMGAFKMPEAMRGEVLACLPWLAMSVPVSIVSGVLGSVLQAREWFGVTNAINVFNVFLTQMVPLGVAFFHGPDLVWLIPAILLARAAGAVPMFWAVARALPLGAGGGFSISLVPKLFSYAGWITVTNIITPFLTTADRMLIGSMINPGAVAYYTVSYNLVTRAQFIPGALSSSLFPRFAHSDGPSNFRAAEEAIINLGAVMALVVVVGNFVLPSFMRIWVGQGFALHAAPIGLILFASVWMNGLNFIPYGLLQATNRPRLNAIFHLAEVAPFLAFLWFGIDFFGLVGAAWACVVRCLLDGFLLFYWTGCLGTWKKIWPGALFVTVSIFIAPYRCTFGSIATDFILLAVCGLWSWSTSHYLRRLLRQIAVSSTLRFERILRVVF